MFFITFTCHQRLPLLAKVNGYDLVYKWFDYIKENGHSVNGYVIMPNHVHALISFIDTTQSINTIVGNGKRFMAYEIIARLQAQNETELLELLTIAVEAKRKDNNKQHAVWKLSFDWKDCRSNDFVWQKLNYMHNNPCSGKWQLSENALAYPHSSARFYLTGEQGIYHIRNFMEMEDVVFNERHE